MQTAYKTHAASTIFLQRRAPLTAAVSSRAHPRSTGTGWARAMPCCRSSSQRPQNHAGTCAGPYALAPAAAGDGSTAAPQALA